MQGSLETAGSIQVQASQQAAVTAQQARPMQETSLGVTCYQRSKLAGQQEAG